MIKLVGLYSALILLSACTAATARAGEETAEQQSLPIEPTIQESAPAEATPEPEIAPASDTILSADPYCDGALVQGGLVICNAEPGSIITVGNKQLTIAENGLAHFGIGRAASSPLNWSHSSGTSGSLEIAKRNDKYRELTGLDCDKVDARSEEQKAHAGRSWVKKRDAFAAFNDGPGAEMGFIKPTDAPTSSPFGPTRKYTGVSKVTGEACEKTSIHRGYDMATPIGTPVIAPADGTITLADPDLYYEGGTVFLDHGHGLVSVMMHLSSVDVLAGDVVKQGDVIAKTGNSGRTTGPHLHWAVKWRDLTSETRDSDFYIDPALLLELPKNIAAE